MIRLFDTEKAIEYFIGNGMTHFYDNGEYLVVYRENGKQQRASKILRHGLIAKGLIETSTEEKSNANK